MNKKLFPSNLLESIALLILPFVGVSVLLLINTFLFKLQQEIISKIIFIVYFVLVLLIYYLINSKNNLSIRFIMKIDKRIILLSILIILYQIGMHIPFNFMLIDKAKMPSNITIISIILFAPIIEEIIFRGIILKGLLQTYSSNKALLIVSIIFACIHFNLLQGFGALIFALIIGIVYIKTKSVGMAIILHVIYNLSGVIGIYLNNKYGNTQINSIADIYGTYSIYIIGTSLLLIGVLLFRIIRKRHFIFQFIKHQ